MSFNRAIATTRSNIVTSETIALNQPFQIAGTSFNDLNGNGFRDTQLIKGANPDVVFAIDISGSADKPFEGTATGDVNQDGLANTRLDAEIAALLLLNQQIRTQGLGDDAEIGIVAFSGNAVQLDLNPAVAGLQITTTVNADHNNNGTPDIEEILTNITSGAFGVGNNTGTNFESALQKVENTFTTIGTATGDGNLIFFSDGKVNAGGSIDDEIARLNNLNVNLSAFGVGGDSALADLRAIDADAIAFTSTNKLLEVLTNPESNLNFASFIEPGLAGVSIYLDLNNNSLLDQGEPVQITVEDNLNTADINETGQYKFTNLAPGTYTVRQVIPNGFVQTAPNLGSYTVELGVGDFRDHVDFGNNSTNNPIDEPSGDVTVYRFFNTNFGNHFYTTSEIEKDSVIANLPHYAYEGASFLAASAADPLTGIVPVYRFFNTSSGNHLYTISEVEKDYIEENLSNYNFEGVAYNAYQIEREGTIPLYRFYNSVIDAHFFTPSATERDAVLANLPDYQLESANGVSFYVEPLTI